MSTKEEFTAEQRRRWISAINREDLTNSILENDRDCNKHFVWRTCWRLVSFYVDWLPTFCLGHSPVNNKCKWKTPRQLKVDLGEELPKDGNVDLSCLKMRWKIKCWELTSWGRQLKKLPFSEEEGLDDNLQRDWATDATSQKWNWRWEWASLDCEQTTVDAGTQTVNSDFKVKIQTRAAWHKQMNLSTYSRRQSSSILQKRVRFYTGLPGFDVPFC